MYSRFRVADDAIVHACHLLHYILLITLQLIIDRPYNHVQLYMYAVSIDAKAYQIRKLLARLAA